MIDIPKKPRLSVVIETLNAQRNGMEQLTEVLESLATQSAPAVDIEALVVRDPALLPNLPLPQSLNGLTVRVVDAPGAHYYAQKNRGAEHAHADILACLDSDCVPVTEWASSILDAFAKYGDRLGAVQGAVWVDESWQGKAFMITSFGRLQSSVEQPAKTLTGNNSAYWREAFIAAPFKEDPVFHGPEVEMAASLMEQGKSLRYVPSARVKHFYEEGLGNFVDFAVYWGWCFLNARRNGQAEVPYRQLFKRLGVLAPLIMVPAKLFMDARRLVQRWKDYALTVPDAAAILGLLSLMSLAVGYGGLLSVLGRQAKEPIY